MEGMEPSEAPIYANAVRIAASAFDVLLEFGYKAPSPPGEPPAADFTVLTRIVMSPAHAKTMIPILATVIADYEKQMGGPVPAPGFDQIGGSDQ